MPDNNNIMSVQGQLVGMPLAGPESFSQQQLDYLKRALGVDETVLWEGTLNTLNSNIECSESLTNFSAIKIFYRLVADSTVQSVGTHEFEPSELSSNNNISFGGFYLISNDFYGWWLGRLVITDGYKVKITNTRNSWGNGNSPTDGNKNNSTVGFIYKIVGIHRIAGGNT